MILMNILDKIIITYKEELYDYGDILLPLGYVLPKNIQIYFMSYNLTKR